MVARRWKKRKACPWQYQSWWKLVSTTTCLLGVGTPISKAGVTHGAFPFFSSRWPHSLLWKVKVQVTQSCLTLCDTMDCTVHGIVQARILKWVALPFSSRSPQPRNWIQILLTALSFLKYSLQTTQPQNKSKKGILPADLTSETQLISSPLYKN